MRSADALRAILHQLFTKHLNPNLINHARESHRTRGSGLRGDFNELWKILIKCAESSDAGEIICVLDALDECEGTSREQITNKLVNRATLQRFLAASPSHCPSLFLFIRRIVFPKSLNQLLDMVIRNAGKQKLRRRGLLVDHHCNNLLSPASLLHGRP